MGLESNRRADEVKPSELLFHTIEEVIDFLSNQFERTPVI